MGSCLIDGDDAHLIAYGISKIDHATEKMPAIDHGGVQGHESLRIG